MFTLSLRICANQALINPKPYGYAVHIGTDSTDLNGIFFEKKQ